MERIDLSEIVEEVQCWYDNWHQIITNDVSGCIEHVCGKCYAVANVSHNSFPYNDTHLQPARTNYLIN